MGWFDRQEPAPVQREAKYSIEKVESLLDQFGPLRLEIRNARLKVLITKVTWGTVPYLMANSGGKPTGDQLAQAMTTLTMLIDALGTYVKIQNNPDPDAYREQGGARALMRQGYQAVDQYRKQIAVTGAATGDLGSYTATTSFLAGK